MSTNPYLWLLIPLGSLLAVILGGVLVSRTQRRGSRILASDGQPSVSGFGQATGETREDYVRRHRDRPGVVANGATLVDLYDRIRLLEERLATVESGRDREDVATHEGGAT